MAQQVKNATAMVQIAVEAWVRSLALHSGLKVWHGRSCGTGHSCGWDSVPDLGTSICCGRGRKEKKTEQEFQWLVKLQAVGVGR